MLVNSEREISKQEIFFKFSYPFFHHVIVDMILDGNNGVITTK